MLTSIELYAFRNYLRERIDLDPGVNLLLGANAQGKTNLLEAAYFGATGRSPRSAVLSEMIMWEQVGARVLADFGDGETEHRLEVKLERDAGSPRTRRTVSLDGRPIAASAHAGRVKVVLFHPEEMTLVRGPGEPRRRLLNGLMLQAEPGMAAVLSRYTRLVEQRNQLLKRVAENLEPVSALDWWTEEVARAGGEIMGRRQRCLDGLSPLVAQRYSDIAGGEDLRVAYAPSVALGGDPAEALAAELRGRLREELARGLTVAGPHRDDITFVLGGLPAAAHASQGQQRTAILAFKLAEVDTLSASGMPPVLLLDDVMSELDAPRRAHLLEMVELAPQSLITSAESGYFPASFLARVRPRHVVDGRLVLD